MSIKHIGGRGHKSPYGSTKAMRVPLDLIPYVESVIDQYKESLIIPQNDQDDLILKIKRIQEKINNKAIGYKEKSATRLINEVKSLGK